MRFTLSDELTTIGSPINNEKLVVKIWCCLGPEFHEISATIWARDSPNSYAKFFDKLIDHEVFLKHEDLKKKIKTTTQVITAVGQQVTHYQSATRNNRSPPNNN